MEADVATPETTQSEDKLYQVWSALKKKNPSLPEYDQFKTDMQNDENKFKTVHAILKQKNPNLPEFDQFTQDMFGSDPFKKKVSTEPSKSGGKVGASATPSTKSTEPAKDFATSTPSTPPTIMADGSTPQPITEMPGATPPADNPYKVSVTDAPVRPSAPILPSDIERMNLNKDVDKVKTAMKYDEKATPFRDATYTQKKFNEFKAQGFSDAAIEQGMADADKSYIDKSQAEAIPEVHKQEVEQAKKDLLAQGFKDKPTEGGGKLQEAADEKVQNTRDQYAVGRLSPDDRQIYALNTQIDAIAQKPKPTSEDRIKLADLKEQASVLKANGSKYLYDPKTGQMVGKEQASKEAVQYSEGVDKLAEQYTYKQNLDQLRNEAYDKVKYFDNLLETSKKVQGDISQRMFSGYDQSQHDEMTAAQSREESLKNMRIDALMKYDALNKAIMLNENPGTIREGGLQQFKDRFTHAVSKEIPFFEGDNSGDLTTKDYYQGAHDLLTAKSADMVPKEMKDNFKESFAGELGSATGGIVGIIPKLMALEVATGGIGDIGMLPKAIEELSPAAKIGKKFLEEGLSGGIGLTPAIANLKRSASALDKTTAFLIESGIESAKFAAVGIDPKAAPGFVLPGYLGKYRFSVNPTGKIGAIMAPFIVSSLEKGLYGTVAMEAGGVTESVGAALANNHDVSTEIQKRFGDNISDFTKKVIIDFAANTLVAMPGSLKAVATSPFSTPEALRKAADELDDKSKSVFNEYKTKLDDNNGVMPPAESKEYAERIYDNTRSADEMRNRADALEKSVFKKKIKVEKAPSEGTDTNYEDVTGEAAPADNGKPKSPPPPPPFAAGDKVTIHGNEEVIKGFDVMPDDNGYTYTTKSGNYMFTVPNDNGTLNIPQHVKPVVAPATDEEVNAAADELKVSEDKTLVQTLTEEHGAPEKPENEKDRKKIFANTLLDTDGNFDAAFHKAGYIHKDGFWFHPDGDIQKAFDALNDETKDILRKHEVKYFESTPESDVAKGIGGEALLHKVDTDNGVKYARGMALTYHGEHYVGGNHNHIAVHELGHSIWATELTDAERELFNDNNPLSEHGKGVKAGEGKFTVYGKKGGDGGWQVGEEDFADLFALNKGDLEKTIKDKQNQVQQAAKPEAATEGTTVQNPQSHEQEGNNVEAQGGQEGLLKPESPVTEPVSSEGDIPAIHSNLPKGGDIKGVTEIEYEDDGETMHYGTKTSKVNVSVKGMSADDIKDEIDFMKGILARSKRDADQWPDVLKEMQASRTSSQKDIEEATKMHKMSLQNIEQDERLIIPFYENHLKAKQNENTETQPRDTETIVSESETAISQAEVAESPEERRSALQELEDRINEIDTKIVKLTESWTTEDINHEYPNHEIGKKAKKELTKFFGEVSKALNFDKPNVHANIAPAGGDVYATIPIPGTSLQIEIIAKYDPEYTTHYDNYQLESFMYRIKDNNKKGLAQYVTPNKWLRLKDNQFGGMSEKKVKFSLTPKEFALEIAKELAPVLEQMKIPVKPADAIKEIVKESGAPKGNVIVGSMPKYEPPPSEPKAETPPKPKAEPKPKKSVIDDDQELKDLFNEFRKEGGFNTNAFAGATDPKLIGIILKVMKRFVELGIHKLEDIAREIYKKFGEPFLREAWDYIKNAYTSAYNESPKEKRALMDKQDDVLDYDIDNLIKQFKTEDDGESNSSVSDTDGRNAPGVDVGKSSKPAETTLPAEQTKSTPSTKGGTSRGGGSKTSNRGTQRGGSNGSGERNDTGTGAPATEPTDAGVGDKENKGKPVDLSAQNFVIKPGDELVPKGEIAKINANIAAIELVNKLEKENRNATPEEKTVLAKFVGWGGLASVLNEQNRNTTWGEDNWHKKYDALHDKLKSLLSEDEFATAVNSTINAHYTALPIIDNLWKLAEALGFKGGVTLESATGAGHFFGMMPEHLSENSSLKGYELDKLTARIAQKLYPQADIRATGFEHAVTAPNSVDLAITNVPFGGTEVTPYDKNYPQLSKFNLHNYFIAKNLALLKPGGLGIFITSSSTMDKGGSTKFRDWANNEGNSDFVGAIRLPSNAFLENAGTEVTTDILIYRKRTEKPIADLNQPNKFIVPIREVTRTVKAQKWGEEDKEETIPIEVNEYYAEHPENMLGEMKLAYEVNKGGLYSDTDQTLYAPASQDTAKLLKERLAEFPKDIYGADGATAHEQLQASEKGDKEGTLKEKDGKIYTVEAGELKPVAWQFETMKVGNKTYKKADVAKQYLDIKQTVSDLIDAEQGEETTSSDIEGLRDKLNLEYDEFVKKYGIINRNLKLDFLEDDGEFQAFSALENVNSKLVDTEGGKSKRVYSVDKADIFNKRVNFPVQEPKSAADDVDAMDIALSYRGKVDLPYIAELLGTTEDAARKSLLEKGLVFENPASGLLEDKDTYLSGFVRTKYKAALAAAETNPKYKPNVDALAKVVPKDIPASLVKFRLGTTWIPTHMIQDWIQNTLGVGTDPFYNEKTGNWVMTNAFAKNTGDARNTSTWGTKEYTGLELVEKTLNLRQAEVTRTVYSGGNKTTQKDPEATMAAQAKQAELNENFINYIHDKPEFQPELEKVYNTTYNDYVEKKYTPPYFEHYPNAARVDSKGNPLKLRLHQRTAVGRMLQDNVLLAHQVGTGKTYTMITAAMEMRRLKLANKPMIVVQNATLEQFGKAFLTLYPGAKILTATKKLMQAENRQKLFNKIAYGDWDSVIIPQSFLDFIPDDPERERQYIKEQIQELEDAIAEMDDGDYSTKGMIKDLQKTVDKLQEQLDQVGVVKLKGKKSKVKDVAKRALGVEKSVMRQADRRKDNVITFEKMGIDALMIDEAHAYKKLGFVTHMARVKGIDTGRSKRAFGAYLKTQWVQEKNKGKNVTLATGTPITNTMAELWTMMKFTSPDILKKYHIETFDQFASTFGAVEPSLEFTTSQKFKIVDRFKSYINMPELLKAFRSKTDVVLTEDVPEFKADNTIPKLKDNRFTDITIKQSAALERQMASFKQQMEAWEKLTGKEKMLNRHIPLVIFNRAKQAAIDLRLLNPAMPDDPDSKTNHVVKEVYRIWKESSDYKGAQLVFSDMYQSPEQKERYLDDEKTVENPAYGQGRFNLYEDIKKKLIDLGIPANEIAIINEYEGDRREALFEKVKSGDVRVLLGSTEKMGVGVNVQDRLAALHHIDAPPRPMDFEQRNGRILRQGNMHAIWGKPIEVLTYGVEKTLDATAYGRLAIKQKFINQAMKGDFDPLDANSRDMADAADEDNPADMSFEQRMSMLSGSQYAIIHTKKTHELRKMIGAEKTHERRLIELNTEKNFSTHRVKVLTHEVEEHKKANLVIDKHFPDEKITTVDIDGKVYNEKLGEALEPTIAGMIEKLKQGKDMTVNKIIKVNGVQAFLKAVHVGATHDIKVEYQLNLFEDEAIEREYKGEVSSGQGFFLSANSKILAIKVAPEELADQLKRQQDKLVVLNEDLKKPFPKIQELANLRKEVADLEEKMKEETKSADEKIADQKKVIDDLENEPDENAGELGMNNIVTKKRVKLAAEYTKLAYLYLKKGITKLSDFIKAIGDKAHDFIVKAWNEAKDKFTKERITTALDSWKIPNDRGFSLVPPFNLFPAIWNGSIDVIRNKILASARTASDIDTAINEGLDHAKNELAAAGGPAMSPHEETMYKKRMEAVFLRLGTTPSFGQPINPPTDAEKKLAEEAFKQMLNPKQKPSQIVAKTKDFFSNLSKHIDNPFIYVTNIEKGILEKYPNSVRTSRVPLGRVFEQSYTGPAKLAVEAFRDDVLKGLTGQELEQFNHYLAARRVVDRLKDGTDAKLTGNVTIQMALNELSNIEERLGPSSYQKIVDRGEKYQQHMDNVMLELLDSGLISQETYNNVMEKKDFYAPFNVVQNLFNEAAKKAEGKQSGSILYKIKGIASSDAKLSLDDLQKLQTGLNDGIITPDEFHRGSMEILDKLQSTGAISEEDYMNEVSALANPGFELNNLIDKSAEIIYKSMVIGERNRTFQRIDAMRQVDTDNHFFKDVQGHELRYDAQGNAYMVPKPIDQIKAPEGFGVISYKKNGKTQFVAINEEAAKALRGMNEFEMKGMMKLVNFANKVARIGIITYSPSFLFANTVIDNYRSLTMSKYGAIAGKDMADKALNIVTLIPQMAEALFSGMAANFTGYRTPQYENWMRSKSFNRGVFDDIFNNPNQKITAEINKTPGEKTIAAIKYILTAMPRLGTALEQMPKIYTYTRGMDVEGVERLGFSKWMKETVLKLNSLTGKSGMELAAALDEIAYDTLNRSASPNFSAAGNWAKYMSAIFQFFSARVKGEMSDWRIIFNKEGGSLGTEGKGSRIAMGLFKLGAYAILPMLLAAIQNMLNDDDEKSFDTVPLTDKNNNILIKTGNKFHTVVDGQDMYLDDYIKIPVRGVPATANTLVVNMMDYYKKQNPDAFKNIGYQAFSNATPINMNLNFYPDDDAITKGKKTLNAVAANANPALKFTYEELRNIDSYSGRKLVSDHVWDAYMRGNLEPWEVQLKNGTPDAVKASKFIYDQTGMKITAAGLDHLGNVMGGGIAHVLDSNSMTKRIWRSEEKYPIQYKK